CCHVDGGAGTGRVSAHSLAVGPFDLLSEALAVFCPDAVRVLLEKRNDGLTAPMPALELADNALKQRGSRRVVALADAALTDVLKEVVRQGGLVGGPKRRRRSPSDRRRSSRPERL